MNTDPQRHGFSTLCVHGGTHLDPATGGACSPIFASTAFAFPNVKGENIYPRYFNTPNQAVVARKIATLEKGEDALVFGSGMAAISTTLLAHLQQGDHAIFQSDLYGGTLKLVTTELARSGIQISWGASAEEFGQAVRPETKLIYIESPSNPLLRCMDLQAIAQLGKKHNLLTVIDSTFATPINQRPLEMGIDVVVHSATKYLNGHSDLNAGVVVSSHARIEQIKRSAVNLGGMLDAQVCAQLERGLKTLAVRVQRHNENALALASFLESQPAVTRVNYPGLASHPNHELARRQMRGFGGMLSFELRDPAQAPSLLSRFHLVMSALSLGGVESLVCIPSLTSHVLLSEEERRRAGISDGLIRVSVGIEDQKDLIDDFAQALGPV
jgi:cystathionine beta-lyase